MTTDSKKRSPAFHAFLVLFTILGIPIIIATPFFSRASSAGRETV